MRKSGLLMHISSLPSLYGIGTLGAQARAFIDFLKESGQSYWQILPVSPTGYGNSPYQSFSSYAGNPYFIDLDILCSDGFLKKSDYESLSWGSDAKRVDYGVLYKNRFTVLKIAAARLLLSSAPDYLDFCQSNAFWLEDYALFMAIKNAKGGAAWTAWESELRSRQANALEGARKTCDADVQFFKALQFFFYRQWKALRRYANENGISIIGDIPIYAAADSADVWANPQWFMLDNELLPTEVAGCPPDGFCAAGQLWGNPLYNWEKMRESGFSWWVARIAHQFEIYDVLRLDHFRGFEAYYAIPGGAENAKDGQWRKGPGMDFFNTLNYALGERLYIAEDLGFLTDGVRKLLDDSRLPGMKVLQFAFDSREDSDYLPHNYPRSCVAYTGTHDNDTILGWFDTAPAKDVEKAEKYLRISPGESKPRAMMSSLLASVADLVILQVQDLLELGSEGRMNIPGTLSGNWQWRMEKGALTKDISRWLREQTELYGRL